MGCGIRMLSRLVLAFLATAVPAVAQPKVAAIPYVGTYLGLSSAVNSVAFSDDGRQALSGGHDNVLRLWDTATGLLLRKFDAETESINAVTFAPGSRRVLSGGDDKKLRLWDLATGLPVATLEAHTAEVLSVAFSPDGHFAVSGGKDNTVRVWDADTGPLIMTFEGHTGAVTAVAFSPDGNRILSASSDKTLRLWDVGTGQLLRTIEGHTDEVTSAAYSPDGRQIVSGSRDKTVRLWDAETGGALKTFAASADEIRSVTFSPDGRQVLSGSRDKTLKLWDVATGQVVKTLEAHSNTVTSAAFSRDGRKILSGSSDKTLKVWEAGTGQLATTIDVPATTFSPSGHFTIYYGQRLPDTPDLARLDARLQEKGFTRGDPVFLRVLKGDARLEVWMKRGAGFELFASYPICAWSGQLGPKLAQGDFQSPEGFYTITPGQLNPNSRFHRAFNLGFPNEFDRAHNRTGANLMVHGDCKSIGCYAMTDAVIDELWQLVTAALNNGQDRVAVHVYPFEMTEARLAAFGWHPAAAFWRDMKRAYDLFEAERIPPQILICNKRYAATRGDAGARSAPPLRAACPRG